MSIHASVVEIRKLLSNLGACLDKAVVYAGTKKFDPNVLVEARLAPDMLPFRFQIQSACDSAKFAAARTAGKTPPSHDDNETTIAELRARITSVVAYLETFTAADFESLDGRTISLPRWEGKKLTAKNYFLEHAQPNFFFHLTTAFALLRHNGVDIGKRDYLGQLSYE